MLKNLFKYTIVLVLISKSLFAVEEKELTKIMQDNMQNVIKILNNKTLDGELRAKEVYSLFDPLFDYELMARLSLGRQWNDLSKEQQEEFALKFIKKLKDGYMNKLNMYTDEKILVNELQKVKNRIYISTNIVSKNDTYEIIYKFYHSKNGGWLIYDLDILGVSIIQTYRNQFAGILETKKFADLLLQLENHSI